MRRLVVVAVLLAACGDDTGGGGGGGGEASTSTTATSTTGSGSGSFMGSCDTRTNATGAGQCRDWSGDGSADVSVSCEGMSGTFSASDPCPAEGRVGRCALDPVLGTAATYNYYEPDYDATTAEEACASLEGTFSAQ